MARKKQITERTLKELVQGQVVAYGVANFCEMGFQGLESYDHNTIDEAVESADSNGGEAIVEIRVIARRPTGENWPQLPARLPRKAKKASKKKDG